MVDTLMEVATLAILDINTVTTITGSNSIEWGSLSSAICCIFEHIMNNISQKREDRLQCKFVIGIIDTVYSQQWTSATCIWIIISGYI